MQPDLTLHAITPGSKASSVTTSIPKPIESYQICIQIFVELSLNSPFDFVPLLL